MIIFVIIAAITQIFIGVCAEIPGGNKRAGTWGKIVISFSGFGGLLYVYHYFYSLCNTVQ